MGVKKPQIDSKRFYTLGEIVREGMIPGIDSVPKASRLVRNDQLFTKILQAQMVTTEGRHISYKVKGSNIIKYLTFQEDQELWRDKE